MVGEYVLSTPHNFSLTPEFSTYFCPSYVTAQEASVAPRVSATRQVIQTDGLASGSSLITRAKGARAVMPQSFHPLNMEEECTLLVRGEETTTPQAIRASNSRVRRVHVHQENTQFSIHQLMECQLQMHEVAQKLVSTPLFSFQDLKLSTKDIIAILEDTLNTTSGPLPIPEPHATEIRTASGSVEEVLGESSDLITLKFNEGTDHELCLQVNCLVTNATSYDVLIGQDALFPLGFTIDNWFEHAYYRVDWEIDGHHLGYIPLDLHGNHSPMAHHCMLKEAHTISYIQQASHEWIEGDEEE
ncbi:unnamed protein product [Sphagnum jensenii]|uniref:Uncharacterized protein n=1 Tax=Sphagnum jensenii TaxID=128206 RepID=A0ABP1BM39_9BRYO